MNKEFTKELGEKLKIAREGIGLSLKEVSAQMSFPSYQTLLKIEKGQRELKAFELAKISRIYYKSMEYFLDNRQFQETIVLWRDNKNPLSTKKIENIFIQYCYNFANLEKKSNSYLSSNLVMNEEKDKNLDFPEVEKLAIDYSNYLKLGSRPACVLQKILEEKVGIKVFFLDLLDHGSAAAAKGEFGSAILLNRSNMPWRRNYDLAHEFFHIITWANFPLNKVHCESGKKSMAEKLADAFASCILLPEESLIESFDARLKDGQIGFLDLIDIARDFSVSIQALLYRLVNLGRIKKKEVSKILEEGTIKELDYEKRAEDRKAEAPYLSLRYIYLAFKCYQLNLVSRGKLAEYLGINRGEVSNFLEEYGYSDEEVFNISLPTSRR